MVSTVGKHDNVSELYELICRQSIGLQLWTLRAYTDDLIQH